MQNKTITRLLDIKQLRSMFPDGKANNLNFCLFSTSGVHGTYTTIEELDFSETGKDEITVIVISPRTVSLGYGHIEVEEKDVDFLKSLRDTSLAVISKIGRN